MLSIDTALELHKLLKPHLPEVDEGVDLTSFVRPVIDSMRETDFVDYITCVQILQNSEFDEVLEMESSDIFIAFLEGLVENNIFGLIRFCGSLGL
jgi:hypothetical protein